MADAPDWPKVLSLTVHEFRTPLTVVSGYLRMLSTDRMGPLTDAQRRVVEEAERSCARLSALLSEVSEVAHFHQGRTSYLRGPVALARILGAIQLPETPEPRQLVIGSGADGVEVAGDAAGLTRALGAVASAIARETVDSDTLHVLPALRDTAAGPEVLIAIGSETVAHEILAATPADLSAFDATRGGSGLSLVIARQVVEEHGGRLYGAHGERVRAGAAVTLPVNKREP